ncbi:sugar phosphate isomerase/epimerase [Paenibacillus mesophilus]|uniref:sugar phosphate isomerase/epimerase family protein n=1 Tax=Paenibacillus mesophilus TaxID=2582849 RepID=UPI00110DE31B|nr:sugar phosphate isomerase/epimerase family protein [Paenibacillus mesophilus]TMV52970.1 sugar phosphate isomerase/epimerase [Paenibacillus mesophilus]
MKFAVFTVMMPEYTPEDTITALKKHGYDGIEWRVTGIDVGRLQEKPSFWGNNLSTVDAGSPEERLLALKRLADEAGLAVPNLGCYLKVGDLAAVERDMRTAKLLGAPSIRIGVPGYNRSRTYGDLFMETRAYMEGVQELGGRYGIQALIEMHMNMIAPSAGLARRLVEGFDPARIGVIFDPGNMVYEGYEQYRMGLEVLGEYLAHVHVKNAVWEPNPNRKSATDPAWRTVSAPMQEGFANWPQVIADLKSVGYDGWLSFEDFSQSAPTDDLLADNIAYIKSLL